MTRTGSAEPTRVVPPTPARNVRRCVPSVPIRIARDSPVVPVLAMSTLSLPVIRLWPAFDPIAMFREPVLLANSARWPSATLSSPVVFRNRAFLPEATFEPRI